MKSQTRFLAGKKMEKNEPLALGKSWCAFLQFPEKKSTIFFTLPCKTHQSYLFPHDLTVDQSCVGNGISLGLGFVIDRVLGTDLVWCQGRQYWVVQQKGSIRIQVQVKEETQTEDFLQKRLSQGFFFLACEKEICVPLGNRVYVRQAEKPKRIACKCSVVLHCKEFFEALGKWLTYREPRSVNWVGIGNHKNLGSCRLDFHLVYLSLIRTEITLLRQVPQSFWAFLVMDISHSLQENFHYLIKNRINFVR